MVGFAGKGVRPEEIEIARGEDEGVEGLRY